MSLIFYLYLLLCKNCKHNFQINYNPSEPITDRCSLYQIENEYLLSNFSLVYLCNGINYDKKNLLDIEY